MLFQCPGIPPRPLPVDRQFRWSGFRTIRLPTPPPRFASGTGQLGCPTLHSFTDILMLRQGRLMKIYCWILKLSEIDFLPILQSRSELRLRLLPYHGLLNFPLTPSQLQFPGFHRSYGVLQKPVLPNAPLVLAEQRMLTESWPGKMPNK